MYFVALSVKRRCTWKAFEVDMPSSRQSGAKSNGDFCGESENATNTTLYDYSISKVVLSFVDLDTLISLKSSVTMPEK